MFVVIYNGYKTTLLVVIVDFPLHTKLYSEIALKKQHFKLQGNYKTIDKRQHQNQIVQILPK